MGLRGQIGVTATSKGLALVSGFLATMFAARYCPKQGFGIYVLMQVVCLCFSTVVNLGTHTGAVRTIAISSGVKREQVFGSLLLINLWAFGLALLLAGGLSAISPLFTEATAFFKYIWWAPFMFLSQNTFSLLSAVLQGLEKFKCLAFGNSLLSVVSLLILTVFVATGGLSASSLLFARVFSLSVVVLLLLALGFKGFRPKFDRHTATVREIVHFSYPLGINQIQSLVFMHSDTFMISYFLGVDKVAVYEVARKIPRSIRALYESVRVVLFPRLSQLITQDDLDGASVVLKKSIVGLSVVLGIISMNVLFLGEDIVLLLFGQRYISAVVPFMILTISLVMALQSNLMGMALVAGKYREKPAIINLVMAAVNVSLNYWLIQKWNLYGAAIATLVAVLVTNPLNLFFLGRMKLKIGFVDYATIPGIAICLWLSFFWVGNSIRLPLLVPIVLANAALIVSSYWFAIKAGIVVKISAADFVIKVLRRRM